MSGPSRTAAAPGPPPRRGLPATLRYYAAYASDPIGFVRDRFARYGDVYCVPGERRALYVVRRPDHVHDVLVAQASRFGKGHSAMRALAGVLGDGLLTSDGDAWKRQRRMVQPAFSRARLQGYAAIMADEAARATARLRAGETRDMSRQMMELTLRIVSRTLFGHDIHGETDDVSQAMTTFQDSLGQPDVLPAWIPTPHRRRVRRASLALDRIIHGMIDARRRDPHPHDDLLQALVTAVDDEGDGGRLTAKEVRDQLVTLLLAGHETTSHALTWTLYLISQNPAAEATLHAELARVLGGRTPTYDDLARMPYTEQVLKESMRLYPPAYSVARRADDRATIGDYPVAQGSEVVVWIYYSHRDPHVFPDPLAFRPERFTPEEEAKRPPLAYLPFGAGPRACIGRAFAMAEAKIILGTMAQRFRFRLAPGMRVRERLRITLSPRGGMKMRLHARGDGDVP